MRLSTLNIVVPSFLLLTSIAATVIALTPNSGDNWVINPLTGLTAIAFCFLAFARLSTGAPDVVTRRIWRGLIAVFCTVAAGQFLEGYDEAIQQVFGIDDVANCVLLVVSPITVWMISRFDPPPLFARALFVIGFIIQAVSTLFDVINAMLIAHWNQDVALIDQITDFGQFISLQIYLGAVAVFLISLQLHQRAKARGVRTVGDLSRYLFVRLRLLNKLRHPHLSARIPGIEFCLWVLHLLAWVPIVGPQVRTAHGKGIRRQIIEIFRLGLTSGMDAQAYYIFEFYRHGALQTSSAYLTQFETHNGLLEALNEYVARPLKGNRAPLRDRLKFGAFCASHGLPCLPVLWLGEGGRLEQSSDVTPLLSRDVILTSRWNDAKSPADRLYRHIGNDRYVDAGGATCASAELFARHIVAAGQAKQQVILVPRLLDHPDLAVGPRETVIRLKVLTCLTIDYRVAITHARLTLTADSDGGMMKDGRSETWSAPIDLAIGRIGPLIARNEKHPAPLPGLRLPPTTPDQSRRLPHIQGVLLPFWPQIQQLALDAHGVFLDRFIVEWTIACTPNGPVLISASEYPDVERLQQVHRQPIGQSLLGEHLAAYLRALEERASGAYTG